MSRNAETPRPLSGAFPEDRAWSAMTVPRPPMRHQTTPGEVAHLWASARFTELLDELPDPPDYGTPEWNALPPDHPARAAAVIAAAEQWRYHREQQAYRDWLLEHDPGRWFRLCTEEADAFASTITGRLASMPTNDEIKARRMMPPPRPVRATPDWPAVAIPGKPGHYATCREAAA